ncbi:MAG: multiple sugar transport system permease protein, partial [Flavobacteriaceae bacterium]
RELGVAAAMSNYLLIMLMLLTLFMLAFNRWQEYRLAKAQRAIEEDL